MASILEKLQSQDALLGRVRDDDRNFFKEVFMAEGSDNDGDDAASDK